MPNGAGDQAACERPDIRLSYAGRHPAWVIQIEPDTAT